MATCWRWRSRPATGGDLIRFLDHLDDEIPVVEGQKIVAITDNLSTRSTEEVEQWLRTTPRWSFQFTSKHASCLNQIESSSPSSTGGYSSTGSSPARTTSPSRCSPNTETICRDEARSVV